MLSVLFALNIFNDLLRGRATQDVTTTRQRRAGRRGDLYDETKLSLRRIGFAKPSTYAVICLRRSAPSNERPLKPHPTGDRDWTVSGVENVRLVGHFSRFSEAPTFSLLDDVCICAWIARLGKSVGGFRRSTLFITVARLASTRASDIYVLRVFLFFVYFRKYFSLCQPTYSNVVHVTQLYSREKTVSQMCSLK